MNQMQKNRHLIHIHLLEIIRQFAMNTQCSDFDHSASELTHVHQKKQNNQKDNDFFPSQSNIYYSQTQARRSLQNTLLIINNPSYVHLPQRSHINHHSQILNSDD